MRLVSTILGCALACSANAGLIERHTTLGYTGLGEELNEIVSFDEVSLQAGDRFVLTVDMGLTGMYDYGTPSQESFSFFLAENSGQTGFLFDLTMTFSDAVGNTLTNPISGSFGGPIGGFFVENITDSAFLYRTLILDWNITYQEPGRSPFVANDMRIHQRFLTPGASDYGGGLVGAAAVPAPPAVWLMLTGLLGMGFFRRKAHQGNLWVAKLRRFGIVVKQTLTTSAASTRC